MNIYEDRKKEINKNIIISFSSIGIANLCDYAYCDRYDNMYGKGKPTLNLDYIYKLKEGDKLFLNGFNIQQNVNELIIILNIIKNKNIKLNFYIGVIEPLLNNVLIEKILPHSLNIYITNNNHVKCKILPIGMRDGEEVHPNHKNFYGSQILEEMNKKVKKEYLCLLNFTLTTHRSRYECENILKNKEFIVNLNNDTKYKWGNENMKETNKRSIHCGSIPQWIFYEFCHKSYYTICPRGAGEDTHRFYESISLFSIPIVKKTNTVFDKTYDFFPCLVINHWNEVTEELLKHNLENKKNELTLFHNKFPDFLTNKKTILDILNSL